MNVSAPKQVPIMWLCWLLVIAGTSNAFQGRDLTAAAPQYPGFKPRPLVKLAAELVARRNKAQKSPPTATVVLGYSSKATIQIPKHAQNASKYFAEGTKLIAAKKGGVLRVEPGTYFLDQAVVILSSNTHFIGAGMDRTILKLVNNAPAWKEAGMLFARGVQSVSISDMTFDGNKAGQSADPKTHEGKYGNYMDQYRDVLFQRVKVTNFVRYGFDPHGWNKKIWSDGLVVLDCVSSNNEWDGFTFDQTYNVYVRNNTSIGNGRHGFNVITGARNVLLEKNVARNNGFGKPATSHGGMGCGFIVDNLVYPLGTRDVTVQDNYVQGANLGAFCTQEAHNTTFVRNKAIQATACVHITMMTTAITFSNNTCMKMKENISFFKSDPKELTATGNVFKP